jgi:iron(III) transport system permease protein
LPILAVLLLGVGLLSGVPTLSLVWKAGLGGSPAHWTATRTWDHVATALRVRSRLVVDNLVAVLIGGGLIAGLALVVCWLAVGARWFRLGVLYLMAAAWALPGPVIGLGLKDTFFVLMNATGLLSTSAFAGVATVLYFGPSPVPLFWACLVRFFPCAVALLWPMVRTLPPELREAGQVEGARPWQELCYIVWPLTSLSVVRTAWAVAILSLGELGASKLVEVPGSMTFAHEIFVQMHYGVTNDVAAHCLVLLAAVVTGGAIVAGLGWLANSIRQR